MKRLIILSLLLLFSFSQIFSQVKCDVFNLITKIESDNLSISLDTDLPDNTVLLLSVYREYWGKNKSDENGVYYYDEETTVKEWRNTHKISIDQIKWIEDLQKKQKQLASIGVGFEVTKISDTIIVSALITFNQPNQMFGVKNSKLTGTKINISYARTVEDETNIYSPLNEKLKKIPSFANSQSLKVGESCFVSKETPLMPEIEPSDPLSALEKVKSIPSGYLIKILSKKELNNSPWYEVEVYNGGNRVGKGWINSQALMYQTLKYSE